MSGQSVTVNWLNNCVVGHDNHVYIQRVSNLGFFHPQAGVVKIDDDQTKHIDLTSPTCVYHDRDVSPGSYYSYRVIVNTPHGKASSTPTSPVYVPDLQNDIGYVNGDPASTFNYNIASEPTFHIDASRLYNTCAETNDIIKDARTMLRHGEDTIDSIDVIGDPVYDSRTTKNGRRYICAKTNIPYNQANITKDITNTRLNLSLSKDITCDAGAVVFVSLYTEYTSSDQQITFKPSADVTIIWSHDTVVLKTKDGRKSFRRSYTSPWVVYTLVYTETGTQLWENGTRVGRVQHDSKNQFKWSKQSSIDLLGQNKSNCGFSEMIFFDKPQHVSTIDTINHYMCAKYDIDYTPIRPKDM